MNFAIEIKNLKKNYNNVEALKGINLNIPRGSFFGLLGPNGAGKTTTINIVTGLVNISSGQVSVLGHDVIKDYKKSRKKIGLAPQEFNFDHFFNLEEMLSFQAGYYGFESSKARDRSKIMLKQFGLESKSKSTPRQLSGGMKRRLQIAKALVHDPPIIILDEPTAGVDLELRHMLWDYLNKINSEGKTILLTTHYIEEAEHLCKQIAIIDSGKIITEGSTTELIQNSGENSIQIKIKNWQESNILDDWKYTFENDYLNIISKDGESDIPKLIKIISQSNASIEKINIKKTTLEDVFLKLTGKSIDA
ncbi:MAG: ABC transporter ATP-binding protein [Candidatus Marinimicrobia bacterium]|nr:ABC transporter ATP-binding protein [Candidatus Neomarinimicrobiota bacterium]MAP67527.1 ABC transporter ATP-binding protein [Candidatus Neomarinimicrobiota bacterium]